MKHNQNGSVNALLLPLLIAVVALVVVAVFGAWSFSSRQTYKNDSNQQVAKAVETAKQQNTTQLTAAFNQQEKSPLDSYSGPETYGSIVLQYPKTWSAYIDSTGTGAALIDGYFDPAIVPAIQDQNSTFALRIQVVNSTYSQELQQFSGGQQSGVDTITPYSLPKVPSVVGVEVTGQLPNDNNVTGTMVVLPLRNETITVWTEGTQFLSDFNGFILPNLSFSP
jgi:hypothetical protein